VLEAIMAGVLAAVTVALFLGGVVTVVLVVIAVAVRGEDRGFTLGYEAPNRMSRSVRRLTGLTCRDLDAELLQPARRLVN
jgi:hypothetical protein